MSSNIPSQVPSTSFFGSALERAGQALRSAGNGVSALACKIANFVRDVFVGGKNLVVGGLACLASRIAAHPYIAGGTLLAVAGAGAYLYIKRADAGVVSGTGAGPGNGAGTSSASSSSGSSSRSGSPVPIQE